MGGGLSDLGTPERCKCDKGTRRDLWKQCVYFKEEDYDKCPKSVSEEFWLGKKEMEEDTRVRITAKSMKELRRWEWETAHCFQMI